MNDTIYALSAPTGGAIAILRMSGFDSIRIYKAVFTGSAKHRYISPGRIVHRGNTLDQAMGVVYEGPNSYTGEDMAEFFVHGSMAVAASVMEALSCHGARPADPGEFTKRAFMNGKLDLAQAEAVMDVISSSSQRAAEAALCQLEGALSRRVAKAEELMLDALAEIDARLDYADELDDAGAQSAPAALLRARDILNELEKTGLRSHVLREGALVVIAGRPNAGKSSLLNALIGRPRAIVTPYAGTTRDLIEEQCVIDGVPIRLMDTAGLHEADDPVELMGIERAWSAIKGADLILLAFDGAQAWSGADDALVQRTSDLARLAVLCKSDLPQLIGADDLARRTGLNVWPVSADSGAGLSGLRAMIAELLAPDMESACITNQRHIQAVSAAGRSVVSALDAPDAECAATDIRLALHELRSITGSEPDAAVIDRIFSRFCVGK